MHREHAQWVRTCRHKVRVGQTPASSHHQPWRQKQPGLTIKALRERTRAALSCPPFPCGHREIPFTPGGTQLPSLMEIGLSLGQYIRNVRLKSPAGAGNQFDSLSLPGESF